VWVMSFIKDGVWLFVGEEKCGRGVYGFGGEESVWLGGRGGGGVGCILHFLTWKIRFQHVEKDLCEKNGHNSQKKFCLLNFYNRFQ